MISELRLVQFRCFSKLHWRVPEQGAIIIGENAQGKTSLLEAIYFILSLHSPRSTQVAQLMQHGTEYFGVRVQLHEQVRRVMWSPQAPKLMVNAEQRNDQKSYLSDSYPVVWMGNEDMEIVRGSAEVRRHFLDVIGCQWHPSYREEFLRYRKVLKMRNHLLKYKSQDSASIQSFTQLLVQHGVKLMALRQQLINLLTPHTQQSYAQIASDKDSLELTYQPSITGDFAEALEKNLRQDLRLGHSSIGPHRDELLLQLNGHLASQFGSEGQQRSMAIALRLAQASLLREETGQPPILLIDDVFGELDSQRRNKLLSTIPSDSQTIISTTQVDWLKPEQLKLPIVPIQNFL